MFADVVTGIRGRSYDELTVMLGELDAETRRLEALKAAVVAEVDTCKGYRVDGHQHTTAWVRAVTSCSLADSIHLVRLATLCTAHPVVGDALLGARLPVGAGRELGRTYSNPRIRDMFGDSVDDLVGYGARVGAVEFHTETRKWETLNDLDGSHRDLCRRHDNRYATISTVGDDTELRGSIVGIEGLEIEEIFERFKQIEFELDIKLAERLRNLPGLATSPAGLPRTARQRGADALVGIFRAAATAEGLIKPDDPLINIIIDPDTLNNTINHTTNTNSQWTNPQPNTDADGLGATAEGASAGLGADATDLGSDPGATADTGATAGNPAGADGATAQSTPTPTVAPPTTTNSPETSTRSAAAHSAAADPAATTDPATTTDPTTAEVSTAITGTTTDSGPPDPSGPPIRPNPPATTPQPPIQPPGRKRRYSETSNGNVIHPVEVLAAALRGRIRRVVLDDRGVVINMGRTQRFYTGNARQAIMLTNRRCIWAGCLRRITDCQADHVTPWSQNGTTDADNGAPDCPHHNRIRNHGYTLQRHPDLPGHWIVTRPDGTTITPTHTTQHHNPDTDSITALARQRINSLTDRSWSEHAP